MTTAGEWFEKGLAAVAMSRHADYGSEFRSDLEEAIAAFDQVLALEAGNLEALHQRGLAYAQLGKHEAALDSFVAAVARAPVDPDLRLAVAQSLERMAQPEAALSAYDELLRLRPGDEEGLFGRASALTTLGRDALALPAWDAVLREPDNKTLTLHGRTVRVLTGDFRRVRALLSRAWTQARLGLLEAEASFRALFDAETFGAPSTPDLLYEALRTHEVARAAFRAHLEARAADPASWHRAAHLWRKAGRYEESLRASDRVLALKPDANAWYHKAETHAAAGQLAEAIDAYERSLALWPGFLGAQARLEVVRAQAAKG